MLILARQSGLRLEIEDVEVESLVPRKLSTGLFKEGFFRSLGRLDSQMAGRLTRARSRNMVIRYVGTLEKGRARARLKEFPRDHPIASTKGTDNTIALRPSVTQRRRL